MNKKFIVKQCVLCSNDYPHYPCNRSGTCKGCRNVFYSSKNTRPLNGKKPMYPLGVNEQKSRYRRLQRELDKCNTAEEKKAYYDKVLQEIVDLKIWDWCVSKNVEKKGKPVTTFAETKVGRRIQAEVNFPNTKDMPY